MVISEVIQVLHGCAKVTFLFQAEGQKRDLRGVFMVSGLGGVSFLAGLAWSLRAAKQQDDILTKSAPVTVKYN